jgi:DNA-binding response OmpR family regulator
VTVDLIPDKGFVAATPQSRRRRVQQDASAQHPMLILNLAPAVPPEVRNWATKHHLVEEVDESFRAVELVQEAPERYGIVLLHLERAAIEESIRACRLIRRLSDVPILMLTEDPVRASDRMNGLHAGANDFMSGAISVMELGSRIDQAVIAGGRPAADRHGGPGEQMGGTRLLTQTELSAEVDGRIENLDDAPFTFVHLTTPPRSSAEAALRDSLLKMIRGEEGDRVGRLAVGTGVILHGTPVKQVFAFVKRLESTLGAEAVSFEWQAFSSSVDMDQIRRLVPRLSAQDRITLLKSAS